MKIGLFFTTSLSLTKWKEVGNLEREIKPYNLLGEQGSEFYFFTYGGKKEITYLSLLKNKITIIFNHYRIPGKLYSFLLPFMHRNILKKIDIYKTNQMSGSWSAVLAKKLYKKKLVVRCGYELLSFLEKKNSSFYKIYFIKKIEQWAYNSADKIVTTSFADKSYIQKNFSIPPDKIEVIPNYIDTSVFKPSLNRNENIQKRIICVGRLDEQKNLFELITACKNLPISITFCGDGIIKSKLKEHAGKMEVKVDFKGMVPNNDLPAELNKTDIFILPSLYEGNPKSLLEAMSCGLPCIGSNVEGISSIIKHRINGLLCETNSISIRQAIVTLLENSELRIVLGSEARKTIEQNFSLPIILQKEQALYNKLLN